MNFDVHVHYYISNPIHAHSTAISLLVLKIVQALVKNIILTFTCLCSPKRNMWIPLLNNADGIYMKWTPECLGFYERAGGRSKHFFLNHDLWINEFLWICCFVSAVSAYTYIHNIESIVSFILTSLWKTSM